MVHYTKASAHSRVEITVPGAHALSFADSDTLYVSRTRGGDAYSGGVDVCKVSTGKKEEYLREKCDYYALLAGEDGEIIARNGTMNELEIYSGLKVKVMEKDLPAGQHKGMAITRDKRILVCDKRSDCIRVYDHSLELVKVLTNEDIVKPFYIAATQSGFVFTRMGPNPAVVKMDSEGNELWTFELDYPQGVAVDNNGDIYVCDAENDRIVMITTDGSQSFDMVTAKQLDGTSPFSIAICDTCLAVQLRDSDKIKLFNLTS